MVKGVVNLVPGVRRHDPHVAMVTPVVRFRGMADMLQQRRQRQHHSDRQGENRPEPPLCQANSLHQPTQFREPIARKNEHMIIETMRCK